MYEGTSTEQKAKNAKNGLDSMSKPLLQSIRQRNALTPPNRSPSPLSLRDISPHCGESPFTQRGSILFDIL